MTKRALLTWALVVICSSGSMGCLGEIDDSVHFGSVYWYSDLGMLTQKRPFIAGPYRNGGNGGIYSVGWRGDKYRDNLLEELRQVVGQEFVQKIMPVRVEIGRAHV